jgi:hypothetical protein
MHDVVRQLVQARGAFAERRQHLVRPRALLFRHAVRSLQPVNRRKRDLVLGRILAGRLAQRRGGLLHVQNVVHNLKRQPDMLAVAGERGVLLFARPA